MGQLFLEIKIILKFCQQKYQTKERIGRLRRACWRGSPN